MKTNSVTTKQRHEYFNSVYDDLHPYNNKQTRIYSKQKENFRVSYTGEKLVFSPNRDLVFSNKSLENFKTFKSSDNLQIENKSPQDRITFYLTSNLVPVINLKKFLFYFTLLFLVIN